MLVSSYPHQDERHAFLACVSPYVVSCVLLELFSLLSIFKLTHRMFSCRRCQTCVVSSLCISHQTKLFSETIASKTRLFNSRLFVNMHIISFQWKSVRLIKKYQMIHLGILISTHQNAQTHSSVWPWVLTFELMFIKMVLWLRIGTLNYIWILF